AGLLRVRGGRGGGPRGPGGGGGEDNDGKPRGDHGDGDRHEHDVAAATSGLRAPPAVVDQPGGTFLRGVGAVGRIGFVGAGRIRHIHRGRLVGATVVVGRHGGAGLRFRRVVRCPAERLLVPVQRHLR